MSDSMRNCTPIRGAVNETPAPATRNPATPNAPARILDTVESKPDGGGQGVVAESRVDDPAEVEFPEWLEPESEVEDEDSGNAKTTLDGSSVLPETVQSETQTGVHEVSDPLRDSVPGLDSVCPSQLAVSAELAGGESITPKPKRESKPRAKKPNTKRANTDSTPKEAKWLAKSFPAKIKGEDGRWAVVNHGAGFDVYFRVDKRTNNGEPINLKFPRISREIFLTLKGMSDKQRKATIEKYVRGFIVKTIAEGDDRGRVVAGKLRVAS